MSEANEILNRINEIEEGTPFVPSDFFDLAGQVNVNNSLSRLARMGTIKRVVRGVYVKPQYSTFLKRYVDPDPDAVVRAIARSNHWIISPAGDIALNQLGLDTQVPSVYQYVSSGPYKKYNYGKFTIELLHRANRDMIAYSPSTLLVIQALKALGKESITQKTFRVLNDKLTKSQKQSLLDETRQGIAWIHEFAKALNERG